MNLSTHRLSADDREIIRILAHQLDASGSDVVRWAVRWYALSGPHRQPDMGLTQRMRELLDGQSVGPRLVDFAVTRLPEGE